MMPERESISRETDSTDQFSTNRVRHKLYAEPNFRGSSVIFWGSNLTRPTTSFARGCKLWSRERQYYEEERRRNMADFASRPYLFKQYPELEKHYPGTWRVVGSRELDKIVARLTAPTRASYYRQRHPDVRSAPVSRQRGRSRASEQSVTSESINPSLGKDSSGISLTSSGPQENGQLLPAL